MIRGIATGLVALALLVLPACGSDDPSATGADPTDALPTLATLATKTIEAGEVTVEIDPVTIDDDGASFEITFDTHTVELDTDVARESTLEVDGETWSGASWKGDPPSGHHREGTLTFEPAGAATGTARLVIGGLDEPVEASWDLSA